MPRAIWKGAISFGLVHVPVALYPASQEDDIDFDWLDRRSMDPVGYKRVNKRTGKEIDRENIVKGIRQENGDYVVLTDDEVSNAYPKSTQTIEIEAFVNAHEIAFLYLERPYYLEPVGKAAKVYALLREAMLQAKVIGIARVVMHTKEHLAALIPIGPALMLDTLRWSSEVRPTEGLNLPAAGKAGAKLSDGELRMAGQLIRDMTTRWAPQDYADTFTDAIRTLVQKKVKAGKATKVEPLEQLDASEASSNVVDLSELLRQSLGRRKTGSTSTVKALGKPAARSPARKAAPQRLAASSGRKRA